MSEVKRLDLGGDILLSGETREDVDAVFQDLVRRGAAIISPVAQVGRNWVAVCTQPPTTHEADRTSTLDLRDVVEAAERRRRAEAALCKIEQVGFKHIVTGPTRDGVYFCVTELLEQGATLVTAAEETPGNWVAVCDTAAKEKGSGRR